VASHCLQDLFTNPSSCSRSHQGCVADFALSFATPHPPPPPPFSSCSLTTLHISANLCGFFTQPTMLDNWKFIVHKLAEWLCCCIYVNISAAWMFLSTVQQCGECSQIFCELDQVGSLWSVLAVFCSVYHLICTICTMRFSCDDHVNCKWLDRVRRQWPAAGCCDCWCSAHGVCCSAHVVVPSRRVQGRSSSILPRLATCLPRMCLGSKSSKFLSASLWTTFLCLGSLALTTSWLDRKLQDLGSNQRTYFSTKALPSVHGPWPVRWCSTQVQNSPNTFLASGGHAKYAAFCIKPTELVVNKCVQCRHLWILQRPHCSRSRRQGMHLQTLDRLRVCQPNRPQAAADSHSATIRQLYLLLSNYCFIPMFFDLILTKQCLNWEDVKHRISIRNGCVHCQNANCSHLERSFDMIGRPNNTKYVPF